MHPAILLRSNLPMSDAALTTAVNTGRLLRLAEGVYADPAAMPTDQDLPTTLGWLQPRVASLLHPDAVVGHVSAALIHGLPTLGWPPERVQMLRPKAQSRTPDRTNLAQLRVAALPADQVLVHDGLPVVSVARSVIDVARTTTFRQGVVMIDAALSRGLVDREELEKVLRYQRGWPGVRQARRAVTFARPESESPLESVSRIVLHEMGFPDPQLQVVIPLDLGDDRVARVDFLLAGRVIGEADGRTKYRGRSVDEVQRIVLAEKHRENALRGLDYDVVRWGWREVTSRQATLRWQLNAALRRVGWRVA